jgi:hypothetical protein
LVWCHSLRLLVRCAILAFSPSAQNGPSIGIRIIELWTIFCQWRTGTPRKVRQANARGTLSACIEELSLAEKARKMAHRVPADLCGLRKVEYFFSLSTLKRIKICENLLADRRTIYVRIKPAEFVPALRPAINEVVRD